MKSQEKVQEEIERDNRTYGDDFVTRLAEKLGASAQASVVYGAPVERDGVTVIPVAKARWGFGGGAGRTVHRQDGAGGGGGAQVSPIGFIEIRNGEARFQRIQTIPGTAFVLSGVAAFLLLRKLLKSL